jgi:acetyl-CoA C-acetyltransferase
MTARARLAIVDGVRTPIGGLGGGLRGTTAQALGEHVVRALLARTRLDPALVEEVILGCCGQASDAPNLARVVSLRAGIPKETPGYTVMRNCASGMQALVNAAQNLAAGIADVQIAGGVESMSCLPFVSRDLRFGKRLRHSAMVDALWEGLTDPVCDQIMGETAETLAREFGISRAEQDRLAVQSHLRAFRAAREGRLAKEIAPIEVVKKSGAREVREILKEDELVNVALNEQTLALYPPSFREGGSVTAGNSCGIGDAACALLAMSEGRAKELGLEPLGFLRSYAFAGLEPERMGLGPCRATPLALRRAGVTMADVQLVELNEAFAAQTIACAREMKLDMEKVNVNGGAIALGHPVGFTGARLALTLLREMERRGLSLGLATLCVGGGQGAALVLER